ncbi:uncharacterized protein F4812DRAFT_461368 [Daldinia caldariorum]|uniref:uncharacterized protein n=1 Tax=Daldinia caldariorum TaxID=326644 RepID=UPI002008A21A|nr:uncharacterized protein F4812DRAFT_461368 [Daldinia caldariorum]KAI1465673.1 hypothetical protein F4812DRAFT_461368 [Daldinia caldariorum]
MANQTRGGLPFAPFRDENGRNSYHHPFPRYAPFDPYFRITPHRRAYTPRELLNGTIKAFYNRQDGGLNPLQVRARESLCVRYVLRSTAYAKGEHVAAGPGGDEARELVDDDVRFFAKQLDDFFFFGLLERYIMIETGLDVVGPDPAGLEDRIEAETTIVREASGNEYVRININTGRRDIASAGANAPTYELNDIIGRLMHEMIHAYFLIYACDCPKCERGLLNTTGLPNDGHGPVFLMLHRLIVSEIRRWGDAEHNDLAALLEHDCPDLSISLHSRWRANAAINNLTVLQRRNYTRLLPYSFSERHLVRITNTDRVAVRPNIKENQIRAENALHDRRSRAEAYRVDLLDNWLAYEVDEFDEDEADYDHAFDFEGEEDIIRVDTDAVEGGVGDPSVDPSRQGSGNRT